MNPTDRNVIAALGVDLLVGTGTFWFLAKQINPIFWPLTLAMGTLLAALMGVVFAGWLLSLLSIQGQDPKEETK